MSQQSTVNSHSGATGIDMRGCWWCDRMWHWLGQSFWRSNHSV
ncbi:hypothetical protein [Microcoleus sp. Pol17C2]